MLRVEPTDDLGMDLGRDLFPAEHHRSPPSGPLLGGEVCRGWSGNEPNGFRRRDRRELLQGVPVPFPSRGQRMAEFRGQLTVPRASILPCAGGLSLEPFGELYNDLTASHSTELPEHRTRVGKQLKDVGHEGRVDHLVREGQVEDIRPNERRDPLSAGPSHHGERKVDPDDLEIASAQWDGKASGPHPRVQDRSATDEQPGQRLKFLFGRRESGLVVHRRYPVELDVPAHTTG